MKIVVLSSNDYSNLGHQWSKSLRSIGAECDDYVLQRHTMYLEQSTPATIARMVDASKEAEVIIVMHSSDQIYNEIKHLDRKIVIAHTGTRYRENHETLNKAFAGRTTLSDQTEFMSLGNHKYVVAPVELEPAPFYRGGLKSIGHYPSNAFVKGTEKIIQMLQEFNGKFQWRYSNDLVSNEQQLERMAKCDIYVELFQPVLRGKPYGCFGVTALEAAAMGKIVVTNNLHKDVYESAYGKSPFTVANTEQEFSNVIRGLLSMDQALFEKLQRETIEITKENHSFVQTGNRLIRLIYE